MADTMQGYAPTSVYQTQQGFAPELAPFAETVLGQSQALTDRTAATGNPYQSYQDWAAAQGLPTTQNAAFSGLQNQSFDAAGNIGQNAASQQSAAGLAGLASQMGNLNYQGSQFGNQYSAPSLGYAAQNAQAAQSGAAPTAQAAQGQYGNNLQNYQMGPASSVQSQQFGQQSADQYMSPYMQSVVEKQQRDAQRQADVASTGRQSDQTRQGAFGGSRAAVMDAEAARNLALQKGDIQSQGLQSAYQSAQSQFNADQAARMQAQQANQSAGMNVGAQNLQANLGVQQLGSGYGQQTAMANLSNRQQANMANQAMQGQYGMANLANQQQTGMANQAAGNTAAQFGAQQGLASAQTGAQYGLAANQANMSQQQFGANLGLQGLQAGVQANSALGSQGQNLYGQTTGNIGLQNQLGTQQQQQAQNMINTNVSNYTAAQNDPYKQLGFMSDVLRGSPVSATGTNVYQQPPSTLGQVASLGTAAAGLFGTQAKAKGGAIKSKRAPSGLSALLIHSMA